MAKHRRKDLKHDEFKETIENIIIFYEHHKKTALWIASGIIIALILLITYRSNKLTRSAKSREMYNIGVILYGNGSFEQAREKFRMVVDNYWGTTFANRATFMLANMSYKEGNLDEALEKFQAFVRGKQDELLTPSAYQGIGQCYEQKGDFEGALENYELACDKFKDNIGKSDCLLGLARLYIALQRFEEAQEALEEMLEISDDIEIIREAEKKLNLIQVSREINE